MSRNIPRFILMIIFVNLIMTGLLLVYNDYSVSALMPILPICYTIGLFLVYSIRPNAFNSVVILIIFGIGFIRMVLTPVIYVISGYTSNIGTNAGTSYLNAASLLISYEFFCTILFVLSSKKLTELNRCSFSNELDSNVRMKQSVTIIVVILILLGIGCVIADRSVLVALSTIANRFTSTSEMRIEQRMAYLNAKEESSMLFSLFKMIVFYLQILLPASLISYATKKRNSIKPKAGLFLSIVITVLSVLLVTEENRDTIFILISCIVVLIFVYKEEISRYVGIIIIIAAVFIISFLFAKTNTTWNGINMSVLSKNLCAYFSAIPNVSCGFAVDIEDKIGTFFGDFVSGVPYMVLLFKGYPKSAVLFNDIAHGYTGLTNQIMPLISTGFQYLSIFAPAFTIFTYYFALSIEVKFRETNKTFNKILFAVMFMNLAAAPGMVGLSSIIKRLCLYIPLLILARFNEVTKEV